MAIIIPGRVTTEEIAERIGRFQAAYADNPLVKGIDFRVGSDWDGDPAIFVTATVRKKSADPEFLKLAQEMQSDLLHLAWTDELGIHSYLSFAS